jgi:hypothetical protein
MYSRSIAISFCVALAAELIFFFIFSTWSGPYDPGFFGKLSMLADMRAAWLFILKPAIYLSFPCVVAYLLAARLEMRSRRSD